MGLAHRVGLPSEVEVGDRRRAARLNVRQAAPQVAQRGRVRVRVRVGIRIRFRIRVRTLSTREAAPHAAQLHAGDWG